MASSQVGSARRFAWHCAHVTERRFPWWPSRPRRIAAWAVLLVVLLGLWLVAGRSALLLARDRSDRPTPGWG